MSRSGELKLSRNQERALSALFSYPTLALAAASVGVTERIIYRWINEDEAFGAEYLRLRREIVSNAVLQLQKLSNSAVNCLGSVMHDLDNPASARVAAAKVVLDMSLRAVEMDAIGARIDKLEAKIEELGLAGQRNGASPRYSTRR